MIERTYYLSELDIEFACELTDLAADEIESLVGRFSAHSSRAGKLRGEIVVYADGSVIIRKCFGKKLIWPQED